MYESLPLFPVLLPCVPFKERHSLPRVSGLYFALADDGEVLYVGATQNLYQRWVSHHQDQALQKLGCLSIAYYVCEISALADTEQAMISQFQPRLNGKWLQRWRAAALRKRSISSNKKVTILMAEPLIEALKVMAEHDHRSFNAELVWAVERFLETRTKERR